MIDVLDRLTIDVTAIAVEGGLTINPRPDWMVTAAASDTADGAIILTTNEINY